MKKITLKSPAKINLTLEVIKKLPNGFHELRTVMMKLPNLFDEITLEFDDNKKGIEIACDSREVPCDENNICWKIAERFFEKTGRKTGLKIKIKKNIPIAAGLGGGSSNGASVLLALNRYFRNILPAKELIDLASGVGKDIPFFILEDTAAYVSGMGEKVEVIKNFPRLTLVVAKPKGKISTPWAYQELDKILIFRENSGRRNISQKMAKSAGSCEAISQLLHNDFDPVAEKKYPVILEIKKTLIHLGAPGTSLSGKGPTVFGIFESKKEALQAGEILRKYYSNIFVSLG